MNINDLNDLTMIPKTTTTKAKRGRPAKGTPKKVKPVATGEKKRRGRQATKPPVHFSDYFSISLFARTYPFSSSPGANLANRLFMGSLVWFHYLDERVFYYE